MMVGAPPRHPHAPGPPHYTEDWVTRVHAHIYTAVVYLTCMQKEDKETDN